MWLKTQLPELPAIALPPDDNGAEGSSLSGVESLLGKVNGHLHIAFVLQLGHRVRNYLLLRMRKRITMTTSVPIPMYIGL